MELTGCRVGLLINFNVPVLKYGIKRMVLREQQPLPLRASRSRKAETGDLRLR